MSFLKFLEKSLDLLSIILKTDSNNLVFFAPIFTKDEKIHTKYNCIRAGYHSRSGPGASCDST